MPCSWQKEDYFTQLMSNDKKSYTALEMLVDDLHAEKEKTVNTFLCHSGSEDFLWGLVRLLGSDTARVAGNAAYIIGTLAESELGCIRVISLVRDGSTDSSKILSNLTRMLTFDDSESVMNAAGTMGTLAESYEGREWILSEKCLPSTLEHITTLLHSENLWTASNAALVLARLSISEDGCNKVLSHDHSQMILSKLILSLGVDEAGRGMNAAFAIGRLCDMEHGRKRLLQLGDSERMISSLAKMLSCDDTGASKNACFALSCLATNSEGHTRLLSNVHSDDILKTLAILLSAEDPETGWFAAMTLRTLASQPKGCLRLRDHPQVLPALKIIESKDDVNADLKEEAIITLEILKRLPKPSPPLIDVVAGDKIKAAWDPINTKSGFPVRYQLFDGTKCVYTGKDCTCEVTGLLPSTTYTYKLRAYTEGDESPFSETVTIMTEETVPGPPQSVRILGATITQLKIGWDPPETLNGVSKGYYVYLNDKEVQHTIDTNIILTGLTANTNYEIEICASTAKGKGDRASTIGTTSEIGAHAPGKPQINVIGRNELFVAWTAPEVPLGRFNRYDVIMNDKIIYSGNDLNMPVRRLTPDTEYSFVVVALTSEGKFESKMAKKRTAKDEYDSARPPLYQTPKKEVVEEGSKTPVANPPPPQKRRKSSARITSGKASLKRVSTGKERARSGQSHNSEQRPGSAEGEGSHVSSVDVVIEKPAPLPPAPTIEPKTTVEQTPGSQPAPKPTSAGRRVAEVKYEQPQPRPVSKTKPTRHPLKPEKVGSMNKVSHSQPLVMSSVSMQNNKGEAKEEMPDKGLDLSGKKLGGKTEKEPSIPSNGIKVERSKTVLTGRDVRKGKYSDSTPNSRVSSETKLPEQPDLTNKNVKAILNDRAERSNHSAHSNKDKMKYTNTNALTRHNSESTGLGPADRVYKLTGSPDKMRTRDANRDSKQHTGGKDANLPKPSLPNPKYLEGGVHLDVSQNARSSSSPRGIHSDSDWLTQVKRPIGRRSLEKLHRSTQSGKQISAPMKTSHSLNFDDIPDTSSKLSNKFIPMQLRTQPANLGIGQLQRVNTTLLGDSLSDNSASFRRLEALTRSQTQIELRSQQAQIPLENRRDLPLPPSREGSRNHAGRKSLGGSPQKLNKLGATSSSQQKNKEPDSMLLQQSWGLTGADRGTLQNVR